MNEIQPLLTKLQELKKEIRKVIIGQRANVMLTAMA